MQAPFALVLSRCTLVVGLVVLSAASCTGQPVARQVSPGGRVLVSLDQVLPDVRLGFASDIAGTDPQRDSVRFVLCVQSSPGCNPDPALVPRQGYRLRTTYVSRIAADRASLAGGQAIASAIVQVPLQGSHVPPVGAYLLEPRIQRAGEGEQLAVPSQAVGVLEIVSPIPGGTSLVTPGDALSQELQARVPGLALAIVERLPAGEERAVAADVRIEFPAERVQIRGIAPGAGTAIAEIVESGPGFVRIAYTSEIEPGEGAASAERQAFALTLEATDSERLLSDEFMIVSQRVYDSDLQPAAATRFFVGEIF